MRYVFVSDIHGEYDKLLLALKKVNFDKNVDTLVSVGDPFDRGAKSKEVLEFLLDCPNRILIWGNHDLRLQEVMMRDLPRNKYDDMNGLNITFNSFAELDNSQILPTMVLKIKMQEDGIYEKLWQYFDECVFAIEFKDLIATHAWVPGYPWGGLLHISQYWRKAGKDLWKEATWNNTELYMASQAYPDKPLLVGHWHAWRLRNRFDGVDTMDCSSYITNNVIAIDGCSNADEGLVNTFVYTTDDKPIMYDGRI